jgi:hypothetical protein
MGGRIRFVDSATKPGKPKNNPRQARHNNKLLSRDGNGVPMSLRLTNGGIQWHDLTEV